MSEPIRMGRKYQTRDGKPVSLVSINATEVTGRIGERPELQRWNITGGWLRNGRQSRWDLIPAEEGGPTL